MRRYDTILNERKIYMERTMSLRIENRRVAAN